MIARPRVDESGDAVTPCGVFTNSKGSPRRAVYLQDPCEHDGRAPFVEFESLCGLDISITSPQDGKLKITVHAGRNMHHAERTPCQQKSNPEFGSQHHQAPQRLS